MMSLRVFPSFLGVALLFSIPARASEPAVPPVVAHDRQTAMAAAPELPARDVDVERLRAALVREVPHLVTLTPERQSYVIAQAARLIKESGTTVDHAQVFLVVDRNPSVQELHLVVARPGDAPWDVVGGTHVSTGKPGRREHFKTPVGVFLQDGSILGYRAQGTYNENHIRGLGVRGMRVWDFGWQTTEDWHLKGDTTQIRLEMHATDPDVLEPRIGRPDSEGCVRVSAAMNKFIDHYGLIDEDIENAAQTDARFRALLPPGREPSPLAGHALVVYDSLLDADRPSRQ